MNDSMDASARTSKVTQPTSAVRWCTRCVLPETRPGITLDELGVCTACRGHEDKQRFIDWEKRRAALEDLVIRTKASATGYDCIVPVSGGKDSWYQIIQCQKLGLTPLAVTWRTPGRTPLGQRNLDGLIMHLGVDHIDYTINPEVERRFMKRAFIKAGAVGLPMHMSLFAIPLRLAVSLRIPLIVWGENPQLEYGGTETERLSTTLDRAWLAQHGCLQGTQVDDWTDPDDASGPDVLKAADLHAYRLPTIEQMEQGFAPESIFLGAYLPWDSHENARVAVEHGFEYEVADRRMGTWAFADIDCRFMALHHYLKWYKFGFTRAFDNLSVEIRTGRISRAEALAALATLGPQRPEADIAAFCDFIGEPISFFDEVAETFRNRDIWQRGVVSTPEGSAERWILNSFPIEDWPW